ncbi:MAG: YggT family protein [bacterium]
MQNIIFYINNTFRMYEFILIVRVFLSWVPHDRRFPVINLIYFVTEPLLNLSREISFSVFRLVGLDPRTLPVDFSPILTFLIIEFILRPAAIAAVVLIFRNL